jgi:hypothetical protein
MGGNEGKGMDAKERINGKVERGGDKGRGSKRGKMDWGMGKKKKDWRRIKGEVIWERRIGERKRGNGNGKKWDG